MRVFIVAALILSNSIGCNKSVVDQEQPVQIEHEVICKSPFGHITKYMWKPNGEHDVIYASRSGIFKFVGKRLSDGKNVKVTTKFCHMEIEID